MIRFFIASFFTIIALMVNAQEKPSKQFCGWAFNDTTAIKNKMTKQFNFLHIKENDSIADIGSSSGSYEACIAAVSNYKNIHFTLVDIDTKCLNRTKVNKMLQHYSIVKNDSITWQLSIVNNTADSLHLPANSYNNVWLMNTLHEIEDKQKIIQQIAAIMKRGGELVLLELLSRPKHTIHGGCKKKLMDENELQILLEQNGFTKEDELYNPNDVKKVINPVYLVRFRKN